MYQSKKNTSTTNHTRRLKNCRTLRDRALFRQQVERDFKGELGAKAMGIYGSIWRVASNTTFRAIITQQSLCDDNGIRSTGGLRPHLRRLEEGGLVRIRERYTPQGKQLCTEYEILDPYEQPTLNPSDYADFLGSRGAENDYILHKSSLLSGAEDLFLDLLDLYEQDESLASPQEPELSQAAPDLGTAEVVTEDPDIEPKPVKPVTKEEVCSQESYTSCSFSSELVLPSGGPNQSILVSQPVEQSKSQQPSSSGSYAVSFTLQSSRRHWEEDDPIRPEEWAAVQAQLSGSPTMPKSAVDEFDERENTLSPEDLAVLMRVKARRQQCQQT